MKKKSRKVTEKIKRSNSFHDADFTELSLAQDAPKPLKCTFEHYSARLHDEADSLSEFWANSLKARLWATHKLLAGKEALKLREKFLEACRQDERQKKNRATCEKNFIETLGNNEYDWEEHAYCGLIGAASNAYDVAMLMPCLTPKEISKRKKDIAEKAKEIVKLLDELGPHIGPDYRLRDLAFLANGSHITALKGEEIPSLRNVLSVVAEPPVASHASLEPAMHIHFGKPTAPGVRRAYFVRRMGAYYFDVTFDAKCHELLARIAELLFPSDEVFDASLVRKLREGHFFSWDEILNREQSFKK